MEASEWSEGDISGHILFVNCRFIDAFNSFFNPLNVHTAKDGQAVTAYFAVIISMYTPFLWQH